MLYNSLMQKNIQLLLSVFIVGTLLFPTAIFAYEAAPVAITKNATFITEKSAKLNGQGNPNEVSDTQGWFEWGISGRQDVVHETPRKAISSRGNTLRSVDASIVGLAPGTQYFFRYVAQSSRGKDVGQTSYFTTKQLTVEIPPVVIVETKPAGAIKTSSAELRGYVSPHGDTKTSTWFEWGTTQQLELQTPQKKVGKSSGPVATQIKSLTPGTVYFYRIVAENSTGLTYGTTRIFSTTGTTPPPPPSEKEISQNISGAVDGDGVARTTTNSGASRPGAKSSTASSKGSSTKSGDTLESLRGVKSIPNNIFSSFLKKKDAANTTNTDGANGDDTDASTQVASVATTKSPLGVFWNNLTGKSPIEVTVEKVGSKTVAAHSPVEYLVTYTYGEDATAEDARLSIALSKDVVYIGDNTANELLVEETESGERTYVLPLGTIRKDATREFSILGMTTGSAEGFPDARVWLEYSNSSGSHIVEASAPAATGAKKSTASVASAEEGGFLPSSFFGWLIYALLIVGAFIGFRKGKEYYEKRKNEISEEESAQFVTMEESVFPDNIPQGA
jgi:hypothetical protein